ncbi:MAG: Fic family protein [Lewinellaceae bacterium]|nr:Fic family protein [Lewinellaceae bacterium]
MNKFEAGHIVQQGSYRSFQPNPIHRFWQIDDMEVIQLLSEADRQLGRLDMYSTYVNIELFIRMHMVKEATQSSRIEGTKTQMEEVFLKEGEIPFEKRNDWEEVQNYIKAMGVAMETMQELPFSSRLICKVHKTLLAGVRGENKMPGEYRRSQNWIGGATIGDAVFVPPVHHTVPDLMSDLEKFANDEAIPIPDLIRIALIHYQFETIHPFLDGNGRVGRLLITLYLVNRGILKQPILYLSDFFEKNRVLYYDNLMRVRTHNDLSQWLKFFLVGVKETARKGVQVFDRILQLQKELPERLKSIGSRAGDGLKVVDQLYTQPILSVNEVEKVIGKSNVTAYKLIKELERLGVLHEISGMQRNRLYIFKEYFDLFRLD